MLYMCKIFKIYLSEGFKKRFVRFSLLKSLTSERMHAMKTFRKYKTHFLFNDYFFYTQSDLNVPSVRLMFIRTV